MHSFIGGTNLNHHFKSMTLTCWNWYEKKHKPKCWNVGIALSESFLLMKEAIRRGMVKNGQWKKKKILQEQEKISSSVSVTENSNISLCGSPEA